MSMRKIEEYIYELAAEFFAGATVLWAEQMNTKPKVPYITLKTGVINKSLFSVSGDVPGAAYYICSTILEVNLYTPGRRREGVGLANYENTAVSDLLDFIIYLESEEVTDKIARYNLDIQLIPPVRDLTELLNDCRYRYRSMAEFTISFVQESSGRYGISGMEQIPNSSGGGRVELAEKVTETIEKVTIEKE